MAAASTKKPAAAESIEATVPAGAVPGAEPAAVAVVEPIAPAEREPPVTAPADGQPARPTRLMYVGPIAMVVAGVGACVPGGAYEVPEWVAADVCRGDTPLFVRATA